MSMTLVPVSPVISRSRPPAKRDHSVCESLFCRLATGSRPWLTASSMKFSSTSAPAAFVGPSCPSVPGEGMKVLMSNIHNTCDV